MAEDDVGTAEHLDNPSPWNSKPSVVLPRADSAGLVHVFGNHQSSGSSGRGKRLSWDEERHLIQLCMDTMVNHHVEHHSKGYWEDVSAWLYKGTGRNYAWQSCKRRMSRLIEARLAHRDLENNCLEMEPLLERENFLMGCDTAVRITRFIELCEAAESGQLIVQDPMPAENADDIQRFQEEEELLAARKRKQDRVRNWLNHLPPADEMDRVPLPHVATASDRRREIKSIFPGVRIRDRSQSPRPVKTNYRHRSPSPRGQRGPARPARQLQEYLESKFPDTNSDQSLVEQLGAQEDINLLGAPPQNKNRSKKPDMTIKDQVELAKNLFHSIEGMALDFSSRHMEPLIDSLMPNDDDTKLQALDKADAASQELFRSMTTITMQLLAVLGLKSGA